MLSINKQDQSLAKTNDEAVVPLTRSFVIDQLESMGYQRDFLPDSVIDAFIEEINTEVDGIF